MVKARLYSIPPIMVNLATCILNFLASSGSSGNSLLVKYLYRGARQSSSVSTHDTSFSSILGRWSTSTNTVRLVVSLVDANLDRVSACLLRDRFIYTN